MNDFLVTTKFNIISCFSCKFNFGVPSNTQERWVEKHTRFFCPNCGKGQSYFSDNEKEKLQKELTYQKSRNASLTQATEFYKNSAKAHKGHNTRIKNRISKGVCPCCNRTFENLQRHMNSKHPDYHEQSL